jgi:hypothetical protein
MGELDVFDLVARILNKPLQWLRALWPIRTDHTLPDLEVELWRFSLGRYYIGLAARGGDCQGQVHCRVRAWVPIENRRLCPITHEGWVQVDVPAKQMHIARSSLPAAAVESRTPSPAAGAVENVRWVALVSKHREAVSATGVYRGKVRSSQRPHPRVRCWLSFLWIEFRRTIGAVMVCLVLTIAVAVGVFLVGRSVLNPLLTQLSQLWPDLGIDTSPIPSP